MKSAYSVPYQHQTSNHLFFDRVRSLQFEVDLLCSYLKREEEGRICGAGLSSEIEALENVSRVLFDDVYKSLREKWL